MRHTARDCARPAHTRRARGRADLVCYVVVDGILDGSCCADISPAVLDACPQLKALAARVAELPEVRKWNARES